MDPLSLDKSVPSGIPSIRSVTRTLDSQFDEIIRHHQFNVPDQAMHSVSKMKKGLTDWTFKHCHDPLISGDCGHIIVICRNDTCPMKVTIQYRKDEVWTITSRANASHTTGCPYAPLELSSSRPTDDVALMQEVTGLMDNQGFKEDLRMLIHQFQSHLPTKVVPCSAVSSTALRRCGYCRQTGHNRRGCPLLRRGHPHMQHEKPHVPLVPLGAHQPQPLQGQLDL
eukprot:gnl/Dysnectes_brevis/3548_a4508_916.p1 GENE.gnl/Dysnectes_brevis/3548_a4508_916~~gnl/Dysnectes_brevis/3548_a4508_916.p1  ORF type:complete len:225 (-),score=31.59 gnl/Dysnectes_brevis/3548_a4508_916:114-788(-)